MQFPTGATIDPATGVVTWIPTALGAVGLILVLVGGVAQKSAGVEDTAVLASLFISVAVIVGGLLEVAIWLNKPIFASSGGM